MGRQKGNIFERKLAHMLSAWWLPSKYSPETRADELPFRRVPLSGGWAGGARSGIGGDLVTPKSFPFSVEAKNQKAWSFDPIVSSVYGGSSPFPKILKDYWDQSAASAVKIKRIPIVLFTKNNHPVYFMFTAVVARLLHDRGVAFDLLFAASTRESADTLCIGPYYSLATDENRVILKNLHKTIKPSELERCQMKTRKRSQK